LLTCYWCARTVAGDERVDSFRGATMHLGCAERARAIWTAMWKEVEALIAERALPAR